MPATEAELAALRQENSALRSRIRELESPRTGGTAVVEPSAAHFVPQDERERQFMALAHVAPVLLWTSAPDGLCDYFNQRWLAFTGRALEQELGNGWAEGVHRGDFDRCLRIYQENFHARQAFQMEYRLRRHDGEYRWIHDQGAPRYHPDGAFAGYIGCCFDITERRQLEARIVQSQKLEAIGRLAGGLAHEFNNLLAALILNLQIARTQDDADGCREALEEADITAHRAAELIRQLLASARRAFVHLEPIDLARCVAQEQPMLARILGENIRLEVITDPALPLVLADPHNVSQALLILCQNARDAMPQGGTVTLRLASLDADARRVAAWDGAAPGRFGLISITDTGCGMDASVRSRLFEPFFTTKEVGQGTGLGLAVVRGIVGQHHGGVEVDTEPGRGTTFRLFLPTDHPAEAAEGTPPPEDPAGGNYALASQVLH